MTLADPLAPSDCSVGTPPFRNCPSCKAAWGPTLWLIIDAAQRPDLAARLRAGDLHRLRCASCDIPAQVNAPILVLRDAWPRLLYSPSPGTTSIEDHNQLVHALESLSESLGAQWQSDLLDEVLVVARPLLSKAMDSATDFSPAELADAIASADTSWKQQYLFGSFAELYDAQLDAHLTAAIDQVREARAPGGEDDAATRMAVLHRHRGLWRNCQQHGLAAVHALLPSPRFYASTALINQVLAATVAAARAGDSKHAIQGFEHAVSELARSDNALLWLEARVLLAEHRKNAKRAMPEVSRLYDEVVQAGFEFGPWLARSAAAHFMLTRLFTAQRSESASELAIRHGESAIEGFRALGDDASLMAAYDALGFCHYSRRRGDRREDLTSAVVCFKEAAQLVDRQDDPANWAGMQFNVGNALLELAIAGGAAELDETIDYLEKAATLQAELSQADRLAESQERLKLAMLLKAQVRYARDPRSDALLKALGAVQRRDWRVAWKSYGAVIKKTESMLAKQSSDEGRRAIFDDFGTAYAAAAYVGLRLGKFEEAVSLVESGRARILSEEMQAFDVDEAQLTSDQRQALQESRDSVRLMRSTKIVATRPEAEKRRDGLLDKINRSAWTQLTKVIDQIRMSTPSASRSSFDVAALLALCPTEGALVIPLFSVVGCCLLVVSMGRTSLSEDDLVWIDDFNDNDLIRLLWQWNEIQSDGDRPERRVEIVNASDKMWRMFARHLVRRLESLRIARGAQVVVIPQGGIGLLPLAAAAPAEQREEGLLDAYAVSYAPSLRLLSLMKRRARDSAARPDSFVGAIDPLEDLKYGRAEGHSIARLFPPDQVVILEGNAANSIKLTRSVQSKKYVHIGSHAYYTTNGGNYAGLYLAHDVVTLDRESLMAVVEHRPALEDFFLAGPRWIALSLDLSHCRLVTLSACESGKSDVWQPDEFLGLPSAFIRAGAAAVVGTIWRVDDAATMLLTQKLYEGLLRGHLSPALALRDAQRWLRDATNATLIRLYEAMREEPTAGFAVAKIDQELRRHYLAPASDRPYAHPYFWAGFMVYGCE